MTPPVPAAIATGGDGISPPTVGWSGLRILVVALCFILNMLDGADMVIMSFIAPSLSAEWGVAPESLGVIFSASLAGMGIGCLFVAPLADRFGRRRIILASLATVAIAMTLSGFAQTVPQLIVARLIVGIGVGTIGVSMTAMASEFAPAAQANFAVGFVQAGWPLAAVATGFIAADLLPVYGWHVMLTVIGLFSAAMLVLVALVLPESIAFLVKRQPANALARINRTLRRMHEPTLAALPPASPEGRGRFDLALLFRGDRRRPSIFLWTAVTLGYFVLYFVISWIPKLAMEAGLPEQQAIYAGSAYNAGSFIGTTLVGILSVRMPIGRLIAFFYAPGVIAMLVFGGVSMPVAMTLLVAVAVGITINGAFNGFWGLSASLYPAEIRGMGIGWAMGVGRIGAVLGPLVGGLLLGAHVPIAGIFAIYVVPVVLAAILCLMIPSREVA